jgi:hypothetical protein
MSTQGENDSCVDTNQFEVFCPGCKTPVLLVDGSALAGVLLDDFEHTCGFRGVINWSSPLATDPRAVRPPHHPVDKGQIQPRMK